MDKAWYGTQIWHKKWDGVWNCKLLGKTQKHKFLRIKISMVEMYACSVTVFLTYLKPPTSHIRPKSKKKTDCYWIYLCFFCFSYFPYHGVGGMRRSLEIRRPLLAGDRAFQTLLQTLTILVDFADSKASPGTPPLPPTPPGKILFSHLRLIFPDSFHFFCRSKIHQKSDLYQTLPKPQKSDPWTPKARFWSHFGCLLASIFRLFFLSFRKMRKLCFWTTVRYFSLI